MAAALPIGLGILRNRRGGGGGTALSVGTSIAGAAIGQAIKRKAEGGGDRSATASTASVPTMDDARRSQSEADRVRRRRGVLANIFGGASNAQPSVGTKQLLGGAG